MTDLRFWTEIESDLAQQMWQRGDSAQTIANVISTRDHTFTRNAVIGRAHRYNWGRHVTLRRASAPDDARAPVRKRKAVERKAPFDPRRPKLVERPEAPRGPSVPRMLNVVDLDDTVCHFPIGDPLDGRPFGFCGAPVNDGFVYCPFHHRMTSVKYSAAPRPYFSPNRRSRYA